tara:strand:+ start:90 stop:326 length:237 start_codon:yes stop_codon:yes gene_type:complete
MNYENNTDIIILNDVYEYDRRNKELFGYVKVTMSIFDVCEEVECLITKEEYDFIRLEYNWEIEADEIEALRYITANCR